MIKRGVASLYEIRSSWTIDDVMNQNEVLDLEDQSALMRAELQAAESEMLRHSANAQRQGRR